MSARFHQLSTGEFAELVARFDFTRRVDAVHLHHTWKPAHADYDGLSTIEGMWRYHTQDLGWSDIAQHVTIAPDGTIWTGRPWSQPPCSATGHNGNRFAGPFMIEMIGDFDGHDRLEDPQLDATLEVIARVQRRSGLPPHALRFHNEMSPKTCPGARLDKAAIRDLVPDDPWDYREAWIEAFRRRRIQPRSVATLSEDALAWSPPDRDVRRVEALSFSALRFAGDPGHAADADELERQAREGRRAGHLGELPAAVRPVGPGADSRRTGARAPSGRVGAGAAPRRPGRSGALRPGRRGDAGRAGLHQRRARPSVRWQHHNHRTRRRRPAGRAQGLDQRRTPTAAGRVRTA